MGILKALTKQILFMLFAGALGSPAIARIRSASELPTTKSKCLKVGGEWGSWTRHDGAENRKTCRFKAKDAGHPCSDGKDCSLNRCEYDAKTNMGTCSVYGSPEGCHSWMENGKPGREICVD